MLRWHGLVAVSLALALGGQAAAQQSTPSRILRSLPLDKAAIARESAPRDASSAVAAPARAPSANIRVARQDVKAVLAELGATAPYDLSTSGRYAVATDAEGGGLVICDLAQRRRLRTLANSRRRYAQVKLSRDARWIAALVRDDAGVVDLWRADNGRHLAALEAPRGARYRLEFSPDGRELRVIGDAQQFAFSVPDGARIGGSGAGGGGSASPKPTVRVPTLSPRVGAAPPRADTPANPSLAPTAPRSEDAAAPPQARKRFEYRAPAEAEAPRSEDFAPPPAAAAPPQAPKRFEYRAEPEPAAAPEETAPAIEPPIRSAPKMAPPPAATPERVPRMGAPTVPPPEPPTPRAMMRDEPSGGSSREVFEDVGSSLPGAPSDAGAAAPPQADFVPGAAEPPQPDFAPGAAERDETEFAPSPETAAEPAGEGAPPPELAPETARGPSAPGNSSTAAPDMAVEESEPEEAAASSAPPTAEAPERDPAASTAAPLVAHDPSKVIVHFATNRNRLAPKDREWLVYFLGFFSSLPAFVIYALVLFAVLIFPWFGKRTWAAYGLLTGALVLCAMGSLEAYVRSQLRDELSGELFGARPTDLSYGVCEISVPPPEKRRVGEVNRPVSVWVFEAPENPNKHFILRRVDEHANKEVFLDSVQAQLRRTGTDAALLFIHGYNVSFEDAVFRTAQLAVDLKFPGVPVTFSWPSYADPVKYTFDEQNAEVSIPALRELVTDLATKSGAKRIHVIAHSMGNRVLAGALKSMDQEHREINKRVIREVVLAAPDIDSRVFKSQVLPHIAANTEHCTLYASSRDRALLISRYFHNYQRLGETKPDLIVAGGMDTIDASLVDTSLLGHSYIGDVQSIVSDLHELVVVGKRPTERIGLETLNRAGLTYWSIKPALETATDGSLRR